VRWFTPVFLATQEAEIRRIAVRNQPRQIVHETLENTQHKKAGGGVGPEFKPQYHKKKKKKYLQKISVLCSEAEESKQNTWV
jgi:hypothetical protein